MNESKYPGVYFYLKEIQAQVSKLTEEYQELSSIDAQDELAKIAQEECIEISGKIRQLLKKSSKIFNALSKYDAQDATLEISAGAGGLEAGCFAREIADLYTAFCLDMGYQIETQEVEDFPSTTGASMEPIQRLKLSVSGSDVFKTLKYECGVHRVQRIPLAGD